MQNNQNTSARELECTMTSESTPNSCCFGSLAQQTENKAPNPFMENNANAQNTQEQGKAAPTFLHKKGLLGRGGAKTGSGRG